MRASSLKCVQSILLLASMQLWIRPAAALDLAVITPDPAEVVEGQDITLTVNVTPPGSYHYQWMFHGLPLLGRTSASLLLQDVTIQQQGQYFVEISNNEDVRVGIALVNLTVWQYPILTENGQTNVVSPGSWSRFDIAPSGQVFDTPTYQWFFNNAPLPGETNLSLLFESVSPAQTGLYSVTVSNLHAGVSSHPYILLTTPPEPRLENWRWQNPPIQGNDLSSVAFGQGLYVAVGTGGSMMISTNGSVWENRHHERFGDLLSIAWGRPGFVAVGAPGRLITSTNGIDWTFYPLRSLNPLRIIFANGIYICTTYRSTGDRSTFLTSTDTVTWEAHTWPSNAAINDVAFGNGLFVAQGDKTLTSTNGIDWHVSSNNSGLALAYGNGVFASADAGISTNGVDWTQGQFHPGSSLTYGNGSFVAARSTGDGPIENHLFTSSDGLNWNTNQIVISNNVHNLSFAGGIFFALGDDGLFLISTNGSDWLTLSAWDDVNLLALAEGRGRRVAVGNNGRTLVCQSDNQWRAGASGVSSLIESVAYGNGQFIAVNFNSLLASTNGESWNPVYTQTNNLGTIAYGAGRFLVVDGAGLLLSKNALTWSQLPDPLGIVGSPFPILKTLAFYNGQFLTTDGHSIGSSADGITWTRSSLNVDNVHQVAYGAGMYVATTGTGLLISRDFNNWRPPLTSPGVSIHALAFGGGLFVLAGNDGSVYSSSDGEYWTRHYTACENKLRAVLYTQANTFLIAGNNGAILESIIPPPYLKAELKAAPDMLFLTVSGVPGVTYHLQSSTSIDSPTWQDFGPFALSRPSSNFFEVINEPRRFYRIVRP